jgi:predicted ester cyclase
MTNEATHRNKEAIRKLYDVCINQGRSDLLPELVATDYIGQRGEKGPAGFGHNVEELRVGFPDIHFMVGDLVAEGDRVAVRWTWSGTQTGQFREIPPSNKRVSNSGMAFYQMREGKVFRAWVETDRLGALQQMGVVPAGAGGGPSAPVRAVGK